MGRRRPIPESRMPGRCEAQPRTFSLRDVARKSLEISSEFYPQLTQYYDEQFLVWAGSKKDWGEKDLEPPNSSLKNTLSSQELERIANQLIAEGRRLGQKPSVRPRFVSIA
jgi:hypothetical protein